MSHLPSEAVKNPKPHATNSQSVSVNSWNSPATLWLHPKGGKYLEILSFQPLQTNKKMILSCGQRFVSGFQSANMCHFKMSFHLSCWSLELLYHITICTYVHIYCFHIFVHYLFSFVVFVLMLCPVQCCVRVPHLANKAHSDVGTESQAVGPLWVILGTKARLDCQPGNTADCQHQFPLCVNISCIILNKLEADQIKQTT